MTELNNKQKEQLIWFHLKGIGISELAKALELKLEANNADAIKAWKEEAYDIYKKNIMESVKEFMKSGRIKIVEAKIEDAKSEPEDATPEEPEKKVAEKPTPKIDPKPMPKAEAMKTETKAEEKEVVKEVVAEQKSEVSEKSAPQDEDEPATKDDDEPTVDIPEDTVNDIISDERPVVIEAGEFADAVLGAISKGEDATVLTEIPDDLPAISIMAKDLIMDIEVPHILIRPLYDSENNTIKVRIKRIN